MGLMFDDSNELVCSECGSHYFFEREEHMLDKNVKAYDTDYVETSRRYSLRCAECNKLIATNVAPKVVKPS